MSPLFQKFFGNNRENSNRSNAPRSRKLQLEPLESREMLSISAVEFAAIRSANPGLNLSANMGDYNVIEITAAQLSAQALQAAVDAAAETVQDDLIVVRTDAKNHTLTLQGSPITIDVNSEWLGSVAIVSLSSSNTPLIVDTLGMSRAFRINNGDVALGGMEIVGQTWSFDVGKDYDGLIAVRGLSTLTTSNLSTTATVSTVTPADPATLLDFTTASSALSETDSGAIIAAAPADIPTIAPFPNWGENRPASVPSGAKQNNTSEYMTGSVWVTLVLFEYWDLGLDVNRGYQVPVRAVNPDFDPGLPEDKDTNPRYLNNGNPVRWRDEVSWWTNSQITGVIAQVNAGLDFWEYEFDIYNPDSQIKLTFYIDTTWAWNVNGANPFGRAWGTRESIYGAGDPIISGVGNAIAAFENYQRVTTSHLNDNQRKTNNTDWAFTAYVINTNSESFVESWTNSVGTVDDEMATYVRRNIPASNAWIGGPSTQLYNNSIRYPSITRFASYINPTASTIGMTVAHEVGHIFYALDEYLYSPPPAFGGPEWHDPLIVNGDTYHFSSYHAFSGYFGTQNTNAIWQHPDNYLGGDPNASRNTTTIMGSGTEMGNAWAAYSSGLPAISGETALMIGWRTSGDGGVLDILDVPMTLYSTSNWSYYDNATGLFVFEGTSSVVPLQSQNPRMPEGGVMFPDYVYPNAGTMRGNSITLNTVDVLQYKLDNGEWVTCTEDGKIVYYSTTAETTLALHQSGQENVGVSAKIGDLSPGQHTIFFRTLCLRTGVSSVEWSRSFVAVMVAPINFRSTGLNVIRNEIDLHLAWNPVKGATHYEIRYRTGTGTWTTQTVWATPDGLMPVGIIANVTLGAKYELQIRALSKDNVSGVIEKISDWSKEIFVTVPPAIPTGLGCLKKDAGFVSLAWNAVPWATGYEIQYRAGSGAWTTVSGFSDTTRLIAGLNPDTEYEFQVRAVNVAGAADLAGGLGWSQSLFVMTPAAVPENFRRIAWEVDSVTLQWDVVARAAAYEIRYREYGTGLWVLWPGPLNGLTTTATITGLDSGTRYEFQIRTEGSTKPGNYSEWSAIATATTLPEAPLHLMCFDPTDVSVSLAWDAVKIATSYEVQYRVKTGPGPWLWPMEWVDLSATSKTIAGLSPSVMYEFRVRAVGAGWYSDWSDLAEATTLSAAPAKFHTTGWTADTVSLAWEAVMGATGYEIQYCVDDGTDEWVSESGISGISVTIGGLTPGKAYKFQIRTEGISDPAWSKPLIVTTIPAAPTGFICTDRTTDIVWLEWDATPGADRYEIQYCSAGSTTWISVGIQGTRTVIRNLNSDTVYNFQVRAVGVGGNSDWTLPPTPVATRPEMPGNFRCTGWGTDTVDLKWNPVTGAVGYEIQYRIAGTATWLSRPAIGAGQTSESVPGLNPGTKYEFQIRAEGTNGEFSRWSDLIPPVATRPAAPTNFRYTNLKTNEITLKWDAANGAERYVIRYRTASGTWFSRETQDTTIVIPNLTPGTSYEFQIRSVAAGGESSDWSDLIPPVATLPTVPANFRCTAWTANTVDLEWGSVVGAVGGYEVQYRVAGTATWLSIVTSKTVPGLDAGTKYEFQIRAVGANGESDWTKSVFATTLPAVPVGFVCTDFTTNTVVLGWGPVSGAESYEIQYRTGTGSWIPRLVGGDKTSETISGLDSAARYEFRIRVVGESGESRWTSPSIFVTTRPEAPVNFQSTSVKKSEVELTWGIVARATGYEIQYCIDDGTERWVSWSVRGGLTSKDTITGLTPGKAYKFKIRAVGADGESEWASTTLFLTTTDELAAPALVLTALGVDTVRMTWNSVPNASEYKVQWATDAGFASIVGEETLNTTTRNISSLEPGTTYYVRIMAIGIGNYRNSKWSSVSSVTTDRIKLGTPGSIVATPLSGTGGINVAWGAVSNASGYRIRYATDNNFTNSVTITVDSPAVSKDIFGLEPMTTYYFQVAAIGTEGYSDSDWSGKISATVGPIKLGTPTIGVTALGANEIRVAWNPVPNASNYEIQWATDPAFTAAGIVGSDTVGSSTNSKTISNLKAGTTYYVRVTAIGRAPYESSDDSPVKSATTSTAFVPSHLVVSDGGMVDPDLVIKGETFSVITGRINNIGDTPSGSYTLTFYASTNPGSLLSGIELGTKTMPSLAPGERTYAVFDGISTKLLEAGESYYIGWWITGAAHANSAAYCYTNKLTVTSVALMPEMLAAMAMPEKAPPTYEVSGPEAGELLEQTWFHWEISAATASDCPIRDWEVNWGDGSRMLVEGGPRSRISASHSFQTPGTYTVTARTVDFDGVVNTIVVGTYTVSARATKPESAPVFSLFEELASIAASPLPNGNRIVFAEYTTTETMRLRQMLDLDHSQNLGQKTNDVTDVILSDDELFEDEWFDFAEPTKANDFWSNVFENELLSLS
ncbi:MAG: fibronectin type III domain-containing protein [Planctomycetaceae bacterium]|nr:fibronectin type III domain-containing protein [Planctomycetaceae bacterium]